MAREYARIRISIADDEEFEELSPMAQWLYLRILVPDPTLNYCGVADWRPKRLVGKARGLTLATILEAAGELERGRYALFDLDTEEVLVRSFIRGDELLRNPKMAVTVISAYRAVASKTLRAAVVSEIKKDRQQHPDYSSWSSPISKDDLAVLVSRPDLESVGYTNQIGDREPVDIGNRNTNRITNPEQVPITEPVTNGNTNPIRSTSPAPSTYTMHQAPSGGYVSTEGHQSDDSRTEPPPATCTRHPQGTEAPCVACKQARGRFETWQAQEAQRAKTARSLEAKRAAETRALAIAACSMCDPEGYQGTQVCDHDPTRLEAATRGRAAVQAALKKAGGDAA